MGFSLWCLAIDSALETQSLQWNLWLPVSTRQVVEGIFSRPGEAPPSRLRDSTFFLRQRESPRQGAHVTHNFVATGIITPRGHKGINLQGRQEWPVILSWPVRRKLRTLCRWSFCRTRGRIISLPVAIGHRLYAASTRVSYWKLLFNFLKDSKRCNHLCRSNFCINLSD